MEGICQVVLAQKRAIGIVAFIMLLGISLFVVPLSVLTLLFLMFLLANHASRPILQRLIVVCLSVYLGLIYYTAELGGDMTIYRKLFQDSDEKGLFEFILSQRKELVFSSYTYIMQKLTLKSFNLYVGFTISVMYLLIGMSLMKYSILREKFPGDFTVLIIMVMLFPPLFHLNGVIFRQNFALSLSFFAIVHYRTELYKLLIVSLISVLIHYSAAFIIMIYCITINSYSLKRSSLVLLIGLLFYLYGIEVLVYLGKYSESIKYLYLRLVRTDIYESVDTSNIANMVVPKITFISQVIIAVINLSKGKNFFSRMFIVYAILMAVIILAFNYRVLEYRLFLMNYFFLGFVCLELLNRSHIKLSKLLSIIFYPAAMSFLFLYISYRNVQNNYLETWWLISSPLSQAF